MITLEASEIKKINKRDFRTKHESTQGTSSIM